MIRMYCIESLDSHKESFIIEANAAFVCSYCNLYCMTKNKEIDY
jgi:hypothetical protein